MLTAAAINGGRTPVEHPAIPITPAQQAEEAAESAAAAIHVRAPDGGENLAAGDAAAALEAVRAACPGTGVGIRTGARIVPHADRRLALMGTLGCPAGPRFRGIGVEAGAWNAGDTSPKRRCIVSTRMIAAPGRVGWPVEPRRHQPSPEPSVGVAA